MRFLLRSSAYRRTDNLSDVSEDDDVEDVMDEVDMDKVLLRRGGSCTSTTRGCLVPESLHLDKNCR